jgi:hypothetical protein
MKTNVKALAGTVALLPAKDRTYLAEQLIAGLEEDELERQWIEEASRRQKEVRSGRVKPIPAQEVYRRIDALLGK